MAPRSSTRRAKVASAPLSICRVINGFILSVSSSSNLVALGIRLLGAKLARKNRVSKRTNRQWPMAAIGSEFGYRSVSDQWAGEAGTAGDFVGAGDLGTEGSADFNSLTRCRTLAHFCGSFLVAIGALVSA